MKRAIVLSVAGAALSSAVLSQGGAGSFLSRPTACSHSYAEPRDFVVVREGTPFVVPQDHVFVATGVGSAANIGACSAAFDGRVVASGLVTNGPEINPGIFSELPPGLVADEGTTVECVVSSFGPGTTSGYGRIWGLLLRKDASGRAPPVALEHPPLTSHRVIIHEGEPFVVPQGKIFVLTAIGSTASYPNHSVAINGVVEASGCYKHYYTTSIVDLPPGLMASSGATIEVVDMPYDSRDFGEGVALGYLRDL